MNVYPPSNGTGDNVMKELRFSVCANYCQQDLRDYSNIRRVTKANGAGSVPTLMDL